LTRHTSKNMCRKRQTSQREHIFVCQHNISICAATRTQLPQRARPHSPTEKVTQIQMKKTLTGKIVQSVWITGVRTDPAISVRFVYLYFDSNSSHSVQKMCWFSAKIFNAYFFPTSANTSKTAFYSMFRILTRIFRYSFYLVELHQIREKSSENSG
jgi:hypothetical protein